MRADHAAIALPADPEVAQAILDRGRRPARHLGIGWAAILIQSPFDVAIAHLGADV